MKKLLLFGGAFDPPHNGHMLLLKSAIDTVCPDKVVVMPTGTPPHKSPNIAKANIRLEMCRCFLVLCDDVVIDDEEIKRTSKSYTVDTLDCLAKKYADYEIYLSIGSDMFLSFEQWHKFEEILKKASLVVHCRTESDVKKVDEFERKMKTFGAKIIKVHAEIKEVSSTQVRAAVQKRQSVKHLVPEYVWQCIEANNLYM